MSCWCLKWSFWSTSLPFPFGVQGDDVLLTLEGGRFGLHLFLFPFGVQWDDVLLTFEGGRFGLPLFLFPFRVQWGDVLVMLEGDVQQNVAKQSSTFAFRLRLLWAGPVLPVFCHALPGCILCVARESSGSPWDIWRDQRQYLVPVSGDTYRQWYLTPLRSIQTYAYHAIAEETISLLPLLFLLKLCVLNFRVFILLSSPPPPFSLAGFENPCSGQSDQGPCKNLYTKVLLVDYVQKGTTRIHFGSLFVEHLSLNNNILLLKLFLFFSFSLC